MTPQSLRSISRQLYSDGQTFASARPVVRPSEHIGQYDRIQCVPSMTPNAHERNEWRRLASNAACRGFNDRAIQFSEAARKTDLPLTEFDALQAVYRQWLVYGTLCPVLATKDSNALRFL